MSSNPYDAPISPVELAKPLPDIPKAVTDKIKNAWVAGAISGSITLVFTLIAISGTSVLGFTAWEFLDVALIFGLAFGIYKKSRICAVLMLVYFIAAKIMLIVENGVASSGIVMSVIFIYYFWLGVVGTFQYQKLLRTQQRSVPAPGAETAARSNH